MTKLVNLKVCGIYMIRCLINDKKYIGSSNLIYRRWASHKSLLKRNAHRNSHLQSAYNKYGSKSFIISPIEECSISDLVSREIFWINYYNTKNNKFGYNQEDPEKSYMSEETKEKIRIANTGKIFSIERKNNIRDGKKQSFKENGVSQEVLASAKNARSHAHDSIVASNKNRIWTQEQRDKVSQRFKNKSKPPLTPEMIENCRKARRKYCKQVLINGILFPDAMDASRNTGIKYTTIVSRLKRGVESYQYT